MSKNQGRGAAPIPPTAAIDEAAYERRMTDLYGSLFPGRDPEPYLLGMLVLRAAARLRIDMDARIYQPAGRSIAHIRVLMVLSAVGATTPSELARFTQVTPSSISSVLQTLRKNGHVETVANDDIDADGRVRTIRITPAGSEAMRQLMDEMHALELEWADALDADERRQLLSTLRRLTGALDSKRTPTSAPLSSRLRLD